MRERIALNALALRPGGSGVQTYIRELLRALPGATSTPLVAVVQRDAVAEVPREIEVVEVPVVRGARRALAGLRLHVDAGLVHGLDVASPRRARSPVVATFHDLAVFDVPWVFGRAQALGRRQLARHAARAADAIIAVSPFTAERVRTVLGRDAVVSLLAPPPDCVVPSRAAIDEVRRRYALPDKFVLHVGTVEPRKDVAGLAAVCRSEGVPLVLAGAGAVSGAVVDALGLGYVPRADLIALYGAATLVAYPSLYEGFGLPAVEAAACGATVVATSVASLTEVLDDGAAFVRPGDADALARIIRELWNDPDRREQLSAAGRLRAAALSWDNTARTTVDVYRSLGASD